MKSHWKILFRLLLWLIVAVAASNIQCTSNYSGKIVFNCAENNDLYKTAIANGIKTQRFASVDDAVGAAKNGDGVLILADNYPVQTTSFDTALFSQAADKNLRLFIEFPSQLPGMGLGKVHKTRWERVVVTSNAFGESLQTMRIVMINDCHYVQVDAPDPYLVIAKVAGFDSAVYGLDSTETHPILFEVAGKNMLVSTTKLSQFITARYSPKDAWEAIWIMIFNWLQPTHQSPKFEWREDVRPSFGADEKITKEQRLQAVNRSVDWYYNSGMLTQALEGKVYGTDGIYECFGSTILFDGSQPINKNRRSDCVSEASMAIALRGHFAKNERDKETAANLQDFVYFNSALQQGLRGIGSSPSYGFIDWFVGNDDNNGIYYSDDDARVILGTLTASAALKTDRWNEGMLKAILANFRTTGSAGFKPRRLEEPDLQRLGWEHYWKDEYYHFAPHYQSWIWATFLWLYDKTKYEPLLNRAKIGIENMMEAYPDQWQWTNGLQQERARMILPLAWLVRVEDTDAHRAWLYRIVNDLLEFQDECGAIRESIGNVGHGKYPPPKSNAAYGTNEAPLIQDNGDPVADMLYTSNFAFFSLTEAAAATGDRGLKKALNNLADFMVRIQVRSEIHPELDGAWYRGFDFRRWEYWASNADAGWGVWCTETGWTQGWIATMLMMHELNLNVWDFTAHSNIADHFEMYREKMLPNDIIK